MSDKETPKKDVDFEITNKDLRKVALRWFFFNTSAWNWERMQNVAFAWSLLPILKKINKNKEDLGKALTRHEATEKLTFFFSSKIGKVKKGI